MEISGDIPSSSVGVVASPSSSPKGYIRGSAAPLSPTAYPGPTFPFPHPRDPQHGLPKTLSLTPWVQGP